MTEEKILKKTEPEGIWTRDALESALLLCGDQNMAVQLEALDRHMSPEDRYYLTLEAYTLASYGSIPKQRIIALKKIRPDNYLDDLDPDLKDMDPITVYRGGGEFPEKVRRSFSWTTDKTTAIWFYARRREFHDKFGMISNNFYPACWKATLRKDKIIGVINSRGEHEVIQHCGVQDIEEFIPTEEEIEEARRKKQLENDAAWEEMVHPAKSAGES